MNAEYIKAANKLLYGITNKRLREPEIWNDILSSVRSGRLQLWEINDEILRIKYFCKEKICFCKNWVCVCRSIDVLIYYFKPIKNSTAYICTYLCMVCFLFSVYKICRIIFIAQKNSVCSNCCNTICGNMFRHICFKRKDLTHCKKDSI